MIYTYEASETARVRLPHDNESPTWYYVLPITGEDEAIQIALSERTRQMMARDGSVSTPENAIDIGRRVEAEQRERIATRITKIENAWFNRQACDLTERADISEYLHRMPSTQYAQLKQIVRDSNLIRELSFRGDPEAGATGGAEEAKED